MTRIPPIARVLRSLGICVLLVATAGIVPAAGSCLEDLLGCGTVCVRCHCKHRNDSDTVRAACPCCSQHPRATDHITFLSSAILPPATPLLMIPPDRGVPPGGVRNWLSFSPAIPHPPPRTL